jgi:hypothetical protein
VGETETQRLDFVFVFMGVGFIFGVIVCYEQKKKENEERGGKTITTIPHLAHYRTKQCCFTHVARDRKHTLIIPLYHHQSPSIIINNKSINEQQPPPPSPRALQDQTVLFHTCCEGQKAQTRAMPPTAHRGTCANEYTPPAQICAVFVFIVFGFLRRRGWGREIMEM